MTDLLLASRPVSWINTALPFLAGALSVRLGWSWLLVLGVAYFLGPYNLLLYGINDLFDYESDRLNPRKGGVEGALLAPSRARLLIAAIAVTNLPLLAAMAVLGGPAVAVALAVTVLAALAYSAPPVRTKVIPGLDSLTSASHFVLPAICGLLVAGLSPGLFPWRILAAFCLWGMASQALGAIQDAGFDREAGIGSIATAVGERRTALLATLAYLLAALVLAVGGGLELIAAVALLPYPLLAASCLGSDPALQARRAWKGFMGMNLLVGFVITQLYLRQWGVDRLSVLELLAWGSALGVAASLANLIANEVALRRARVHPSAATLPALTVIVPVRNEQGRIGDCLRALLQQTYPGTLELIVVDDSSEDRSREESAAALGSRGRLLEAGPKPEGWTGKCWAAERGFQHSSGELVAFVDADTTLAPSALAETVGALLARGAAMVSLLTRYSMATASERALLPAFTIMQSCWLPISIQARVGRRLSWLTYAFGPCMVLTRSAYQSSGGHRGISSSQREDLDLARAVAAKAGPVYLLKGSDLAQSRHYTSRAEVRSAWRRTYYPYSGHSLPVALAGLAGIAVVQLLPLLLPVLALTSRSSAVVAGSLVALAGLICLRVLVARWEGHPYSTILWHPVTWVLTLWFQLGSIGDGLRGRRPVWRGRALGAEVAGATSW